MITQSLKTKILFILLAIMGCTSCSTEYPSPITWSECGGEIENHACDFTLVNQTGDDWNLYDHYGSIIVLDFSAVWCGYCQIAASKAQEIQDKFPGQDVVWVTILLQNAYGQTPSVTDLQKWSQEFDITTSPVLAGNNTIIDSSGENGYNPSSWPAIVIIDRDLVITYKLHGWNEMQINMWLEEMTSQTIE